MTDDWKNVDEWAKIIFQSNKPSVRRFTKKESERNYALSWAPQMEPFKITMMVYRWNEEIEARIYAQI